MKNRLFACALLTAAIATINASDLSSISFDFLVETDRPTQAWTTIATKAQELIVYSQKSNDTMDVLDKSIILAQDIYNIASATNSDFSGDITLDATNNDISEVQDSTEESLLIRFTFMQTDIDTTTEWNKFLNIFESCNNDCVNLRANESPFNIISQYIPLMIETIKTTNIKPYVSIKLSAENVPTDDSLINTVTD